MQKFIEINYILLLYKYLYIEHSNNKYNDNVIQHEKKWLVRTYVHTKFGYFFKFLILITYCLNIRRLSMVFLQLVQQTIGISIQYAELV